MPLLLFAYFSRKCPPILSFANYATAINIDNKPVEVKRNRVILARDFLLIRLVCDADMRFERFAELITAPGRRLGEFGVIWK